MISFKNKWYASVGNDAVPVHLENCLMWLKCHRRFFKYSSYKDMLLDYGKNGTDRFFPMSLLEEYVAKDIRYNEYLKGEIHGLK